MRSSVLKKTIHLLVFIGLLSGLSACKDSYTPRPKAYLALEYPKAIYEKHTSDCGFSFKGNRESYRSYPNTNLGGDEACYMSIHYPKWNADLYLTHRNVNKNLLRLLKDAQKIPEQHVVKADEIISTVYENSKNKTYGMFYEVIGDAASTHQFYLTDSTHHFLLGSLYFNRKPHYDSIYPAAKYLEKDLKRLIESVVWNP